MYLLEDILPFFPFDKIGIAALSVAKQPDDAILLSTYFHIPAIHLSHPRRLL